jgi:C4-type Zn-finger protein
MKGQKCPSCDKFSYFCHKGEYDIEEWGQGAKLSPDFYYCTQCGFRYSEHVLISEAEEAEKYKKLMQAKLI